ncbi:MAG: DUF4394 domain-containing protein [Prosthecobacter sp.]|uniref:DUF4394 domain-containing protein n=1 Tax=Prosthecobacter sp. TaxID=1965333 RepID=UPI0019E52307|nr:DUF4394 domain-containing protein [Prosthecobacter sp.]MBE2287282.1 DUF4394 domain-containing protein [Prosthecobacter sp.]
MRNLHAFVLLLFICLTNRALAATYDVGPGRPLTMLRDVAWANLQPGDVVNIHYKPGGYHEKIQISASGTAAQHIIIRGIPDPTTHALPIIDGKDAIEDPAFDPRHPKFTEWSVILVSPRQSTYVYGAYNISFVDIESLDVRNGSYTGDGSITYTDKSGAVRGYGAFAAGIYIEWAHDLAIRGCEVSNCGNGIYANSKNPGFQVTRRLLIEGCYLHDNSNPPIPNPADPNGVPLSNGFGEHHIYVECAGSIIQYNRFGGLRPNAHGTAIKNRSSGIVIRYNEFVMDGQSNVIAMPNAQAGTGEIDLQPDYRDAYVYGNLITIKDYPGSITAFMWGAFDGATLYDPVYRGTLHLYNNTIVSHHSGVTLLLLPGSSYTSNASITNPTHENVDCRNNIFYTDPALQAGIYDAFRFINSGTTDGGGDITLGKNWISPGWRKTAPSQTWSGELIGTGNLIVGDALGANDPHFIDMNARDYHVLTPSNILDAGEAIAGLPLDFTVTREYVFPQGSQARTLQGIAMDLGALESTGLASVPPPGGALQFSVASFSRNESGGTATITVTRLGGTSGAVGVSFATVAGGTAADGADYAGSVGTLAWADGDSASKSFMVPVLNDAEIENAETISLALFSPSGGAVIGVIDTATLTIQDDDTPPSTLMYALGHTSNALFLFRTSAPGSPLSFTIPSGLVGGDSLRALAMQPVTGKLFAVGTAGVLYTINPFTGVAMAVGPAFAPTPTGETMDLAFDRLTGHLRLFTAGGQNFVISPATGGTISSDTTPAYAAGDANAATTPQVVGADFAWVGGSQMLYGIEAVRNALVSIGSPASGQLATVGGLGFDTETHSALEIPSGASYGWACLSLPGATGAGLYAVNLSKGNAIFQGDIRTVERVRDLVIAPPRDVWKQARFGANAGNPLIGGDDADPDGNGVSNLMEYALGAVAGSAPPTFMPVADYFGGHLSLSFTRAAAANDLIYTVQVSDDLSVWQDGSVYSPYGDTPSNAFTTESTRTMQNGNEFITVRDNTPISTTAHRFIRLRVTTP